MGFSFFETAEAINGNRVTRIKSSLFYWTGLGGMAQGTTRPNGTIWLDNALTGKKIQADNKQDNGDAAHNESAGETGVSLPALPDRVEKQDHRADDQQNSNRFIIHWLPSSRASPATPALDSALV